MAMGLQWGHKKPSKMYGILEWVKKKHRGKNGFGMRETKTWCGKLEAGREEIRKGLESWGTWSEGTKNLGNWYETTWNLVLMGGTL